MKTLVNYPHSSKKNRVSFMVAVGEALLGEVVMYATPKGNVVVLSEEKFNRIATLNKEIREAVKDMSALREMSKFTIIQDELLTEPKEDK